MLYMTRWSIKEEMYHDAVERFTKNPPKVPAGVKQIGRWHELGSGDGFALYEANDPVAFSQYVLSWADLVDQHIHVVIEDEAIARALSKM